MYKGLYSLIDEEIQTLNKEKLDNEKHKNLIIILVIAHTDKSF